MAILTPKSGWFHCAAERGCGIAIWLEVAHALAAQPGRVRDVVFVATSGHELGFLGIEELLKRRPELARAHAWIHLGASVGAAFEPTLGLRASDTALLDLATGTLVRNEAPPLTTYPVGSPPSGENEKLSGSERLGIDGVDEVTDARGRRATA